MNANAQGAQLGRPDNNTRAKSEPVFVTALLKIKKFVRYQLLVRLSAPDQDAFSADCS